VTLALAAVVRVAACHVEPPSVETSTPATTPPPVSVAVPVIVTALPSASLAPDAGEVIVEVGGVVSVDLLAGASSELSVEGCAPISARRLTVACSMLGSGGFALGSVDWTSHALNFASPHDHCTVPAPNTRAPLGAL
jgi:hypothetical protein